MEKSGPTVAVATLGCKVNQAESEAMMREFAGVGFCLATFDGPADIYVLNSCTITQVADRKSRQLVRQARRHNPEAVVVVTGCYAEVEGEKIASLLRQDADLVVGNDRKGEIVALVQDRLAQRGRSAVESAVDGTAIHASPLVSRTRAMVKVQDGCNNFCSYCVVPIARGRERSVPLDTVLAEVRTRVESGYKEIVLTGVHAGAYGKDQANRPTLAKLVERILAETNVLRLRLSSVEPWDLEPALLAFLGPSGEGRFCRHLHLPLQSGSDSVLRRMRRRYTSSEFASLVYEARSIDPDVAITTDVIVGFPGETAEEFAGSLRFCEEMEFARMHVFRFSPRRGTVAADMPDSVDERQKKCRSEQMSAIAGKSARGYRRRFLGQRLAVLWENARQIEGQSRLIWSGLTDNYLRVESFQRHDQDIMVNHLLPSQIVGEHGGSLWAEHQS
ncbi:MAG: tRNA (N(6)-L-threonylcarbamoyladenosine(37)-C(2))-methylthiotransferase MtaB [Dehalococcoidia bacterium]|nr:tRNA (N(6)-L-threonylcarbamoyladenosine(37)-C(2))-methylthiotransferase MtaB [Dehalococcoidia bacterium]